MFAYSIKKTVVKCCRCGKEVERSVQQSIKAVCFNCKKDAAKRRCRKYYKKKNENKTS